MEKLGPAFANLSTSNFVFHVLLFSILHKSIIKTF